MMKKVGPVLYSSLEETLLDYKPKYICIYTLEEVRNIIEHLFKMNEKIIF